MVDCARNMSKLQVVTNFQQLSYEFHTNKCKFGLRVRHKTTFFSILSGNVGSLFDPENPQKYQKRLIRFALTRNKTRIEVTEVPISRHSLNSNDVFIFDEGTKMTQWNGARCDNEERLAVGFEHFILPHGIDERFSSASILFIIPI